MSVNSPLCALCLETVESIENVHINASDTVQSFKQFLNFSRAYLKVKTGAYFVGNCGPTLPRLCEECADEVKVAVEVHTQVERLKCQLLGKVMKLGEIISRSQKRVAHDFSVGHPIHSAPLSLNKALLQVFRRQVERKCALKARKILPSVVLRRKEAIVTEMNKLEEWKLVSKPSPIEIQFMVALIILFSSVYCWDLSEIIKSFPRNNSNIWFVKVTANSTETTIPTRQTLREFIIFVFLYSLGNDWNLEEILQQRFQKMEQLVLKTLKRKPGRPPGSGVKKLRTFIRMDTLASPLLPKRKPGRPPKSCNLFNNSTSAKNVQHVFKTLKRKPGRPPGSGVKKPSPSIASAQVPKRKPGRPSKLCNFFSNSNTAETIQIQANRKIEILGICGIGSVVKRRRVGRPPKKRRGRLPRANLESVKFKIPEAPNENADSPRKIELHIQEKRALAIPNNLDQEMNAENQSEKMQVDVPNLEASMLGIEIPQLDFSAMDRDDSDAFEDLMDVSYDDSQSDCGEVKVSPFPTSDQNTDDSCFSREGTSAVTPRYSVRLRSGTSGTKKTTYIESSDSESSEDVTELDNAAWCPQRYWMPESLDRHCKEKHPDGPPSLTEKVGENSSSKWTMNIDRDLEKWPLKRAKPHTLKCPECGFKFQESFLLKEHLKTEHLHKLDEGKSLACSICDEKFEDELRLLRHFEQNHEDPDNRSFCCVYCPLCFTTSQLSELHRKNVHWLHPQVLPCEVEGCSKTFSSPSTLCEHYKSEHSCSGLFSCDKCHWPFLSDWLLRLHQFNHKEKISDLRYSCDECYYQYYSTMDLAAHFNRSKLPAHGGNDGRKVESWDCDDYVDHGKRCGYKFFSVKELNLHKKAHVLPQTTAKTVYVNNKKCFDACTLQCPKCSFTSRMLCSFNAHLQREHSILVAAEKVENMHCDTCDEEFDNELNLLLHIQHQHKECDIPDQERISCVYCFQSFGNVQLSLLHKKNVHWLRSQNFHCEVEGCLEHFILPQELEAHYKSSHAELGMFSCDKCHWPFLCGHRLCLHKLNHSELQAGGCYECSVCQKLYQSTFELAHHFSQSHEYGGADRSKDGIKCLECSSSKDCSFSFFSKSELTAHKHLHANFDKHMLFGNTVEANNKSESEGIPKCKIGIFRCVYCEEPFPSDELRNSHERTCPAGPTPEKRKQVKEGRLCCAKCNYTAKGRYGMRKHQTVHTGKRQNQCSECGQRFPLVHHLKRHILAKHTEKVTPTNGEKFVCHLCGKEVFSRGALYSHVYHCEKKHACVECGKRFGRPVHLKMHMRSHTGAKFEEDCKTKRPNGAPVTTPSLTQCLPNSPSEEQNIKKDSKFKRLPKKRRRKTQTSGKRVSKQVTGPQKIVPSSLSTNPADIDLSQNFTIRCSFSKCSSIFETLLPFLEHLQSDHFKTDPARKNPPNCRSCQELFKSELSLLAHLEKDHETPEEEKGATHFCLYCQRSFCTEQLAELHRKNIHWLYPHQLACEVENCSQKFTSTGQLSEHYVTSHSSSDVTNSDPAKREELKLFSCEQCHWPFLSERRLLLHRFNHLKVVEKDKGYQCPSCRNRYQTVMKLADHFNQAQSPYHCDLKYKLHTWSCSDRYCNFTFFSEKESISHHKLHEQYKMQPRKRNISKRTISIGRSPQEFCCVYCLEDLKSRQSRIEHEETCPSGPTPEQRRNISTRYVCGRCGHATNKRGQIRRHCQSHLEKKFQCLECELKFARPDQLRSHVKSRHSNPENKLVCHICGVKRARETDMKYHLSEHEKKHLCPECGQTFTRAWLLSVHMRKHTGERMQCEWCPAFYRTVPELKEHYQSRHPEEFEKSHGSTSKIRVRYKLVKKDKSTRYREVQGGGSKEVAGESCRVEQQQQNQQSSHNPCTDPLNSVNNDGTGCDQEKTPTVTEPNCAVSISLENEYNPTSYN